MAGDGHAGTWVVVYVGVREGMMSVFVFGGGVGGGAGACCSAAGAASLHRSVQGAAIAKRATL